MPSEADQQPTSPRAAVVIVTREQPANLVRCLDALAGAPSVIVVDNGSRDTTGLETRYPSVRFIRLARNFGRTKALNIGTRAAADVSAEFVLLLDPRVVLRAADVETLADTLEFQPEIGAVAPLLVDPFGAPTPQGRALPTTTEPNPPLATANPGDRVECTSGHALMFRAFFLRALRQIDERFGDYGPTVELCQQIRRANKAVLIHPSVRAVEHPASEVTSTAAAADRELGTARYLGKHHGFISGTLYLVGRIASAAATLQLKKAFLLASQSKIDGSS